MRRLNGGCQHVNTSLVERFAFTQQLQQYGGYKVGLFGKYLNKMPKANQIPPGFDAWFANDGGDYYGPEFVVKNVPGFSDGLWKGQAMDYSTAVIGNATLRWLSHVVEGGHQRHADGSSSFSDQHSSRRTPFFALIAPKAAHEPFMPAPWYLNTWNSSWPRHEPRFDVSKSWNSSVESRQHFHGTIQTGQAFTEEEVELIAGIHRNRWRTLMSVDDLVAAVVQHCKTLGVHDSTFYIFTSGMRCADSVCADEHKKQIQNTSFEMY